MLVADGNPIIQPGIVLVAAAIGALLGAYLERARSPKEALSDRKRIEAEHKHAEAILHQYERVVSSTPDGIALVDRTYTYQLVNQTYLNRTQKPRSEIIGHSISNVIGDSPFENVIKPQLDRCLAGETIRYEEWFDYPGDQRCFVGVTYAPYIEEDGTITGVVVTTRDLTDLKQAEIELQEKEAFLRSIYEGCEEGIFVVDVLQDGDFRYVGLNPAHAQRTGLSSETLRGKTPEQVLSPADAAAARRNYQSCVESGTSITYVEQMSFLGQDFWWFTRLNPLRDQQDQIYRIIGASTNITSWKQAETDLQESKAFLNQILNVISDTIFVKDEQFRFVLVNQAVCDLSGISQAGFLGRSDYDLFSKEQADHFRQKDTHVFQTGLEDVTEEPLTNLAGETRWLLTKKVCFQNQHGQKFLLGSSQDITEHKQSAQVLQESEARFRLLIQNVDVGILLAGPHTEILTCNQTALELLGLTETEMLSRAALDPVWAVIHEDGSIFEPTTLPIPQAIATQQTVQNVVMGIRRQRDSNLVWLLVSAVPQFDAEGKVSSVICNFNDITARKQAEADLQRQTLQEQAFSRILQSIRNSLDLDTIFSTATREFAELLQLDLACITQYVSEGECWIPIAEQLRQPDALSLLGVEISDHHNPLTQRLKQREVILVEDSRTLNDPINQAIAQLSNPVAWLMVPLEVDAEVWGCLVGIKSPLPATFTDSEIQLTQRFADQLAIAIQQASLYRQIQQLNQTLEQRVEERTTALQKNRDLFEAVFQESADAIFLVDSVSLLILDCNQRAIELFEANSNQDLIGIQGHTLHQTSFSEAVATEMLREFSLQGVWNQEIEYRTLKGQSFWGNLAAKRIQVAERQMNLVQITDISERKRIEAKRQQAEAALRQSEARFQHLAANIPGIFYQSVIRADGSRQFHYVSSGLQRLFELEPAQLIEDGNIFFTIVHPDDVELLQAEVSRTLIAQAPFQCEYRIIPRSGQIKWIHNAASREYLANGDIVSDGVVLDITDRKQAEAALKASETRFRTLIEDLQVGVIVCDADLTPVLFNSKMLALMGVTADELLSRTAIDPRWDMVREDGSPMPVAESPLLVAAQTRQPVLDAVLGVYRPISQDRVWLLITAEPQLNEAGEVKQIIVTASDISDRKHAEEALRQFAGREHLLRTVTQQIHQSLDLDSILTSTVTEVRQMLQVDRALIFHLTSDSSGVVLKESVLPEYPATAAMLWEDTCFPPECHRHYQQGNPRAIPDVRVDDWADCLIEFMQAARVKSKVIAPIVLGIEETQPHLWGIVVVHSCSYYRQWEAAEVALLQQVANQLAIAIQQSALYQQIQSELTERRQVETQLRASLQEKEILLKEVHHRVKNNLQVVSSMLWLQAKATQHSTVFNALADTRTRLQAMALIHETLYESSDLEQLNFHDYIQRLATTILAANSTQSNSIQLIYQLQPVVLNLETAIPCGLLLNELVTNAIKHAFPDSQAGEVCITLEAAPSLDAQLTPAEFAPAEFAPSTSSDSLLSQPHPIKQYILTVQDNGVGIPQDIDLKNLRSLGLKITYDLALQLRGSLRLDSSKGTRFQLTFSVLDYRKRL